MRRIGMASCKPGLPAESILADNTFQFSLPNWEATISRHSPCESVICLPARALRKDFAIALASRNVRMILILCFAANERKSVLALPIRSPFRQEDQDCGWMHSPCPAPGASGWLHRPDDTVRREAVGVNRGTGLPPAPDSHRAKRPPWCAEDWRKEGDRWRPPSQGRHQCGRRSKCLR